MTDNSTIEQTDRTWPLVVGCDAVESLEARLRWPIERWSRPLLTGHPDRVRGKRVLLGGVGDVWHDHVRTAFLAFAYAVMAHTPWHSYLVPTRRWQRACETLSDPLFVARVASYYDDLAAEYDWCVTADDDLEWPLPNVVAMASASVQSEFDAMLPWLLRTPAVMHGVSLLPLLGPLDLSGALPSMSVHPQHALDRADADTLLAFRHLRDAALRQAGFYPLDWVISGGKSGGEDGRHEWLVERCPGAPGWERQCRVQTFGGPQGGIDWMHADCNGTGWKPSTGALAWVRSLRDQCAAFGIPFTWRQWGGPAAGAGGRLLDGACHDGGLGLPVFNPATRVWRYPTMNPVCDPSLPSPVAAT